MKSCLLGLLILPFFFSHAQQAKFQAAENAYASGLYQNAIDLYQQPIAEPFNQPELYFNLGNAAYKKGDLALAIKSYRRAQYAPTDPDIRANLRYALEATGALYPKSAASPAYSFLYQKINGFNSPLGSMHYS